MKTQLLPDETIIKEGLANMQRGIEAVGGKLYLTNQRLVFESHAFNIQTGATIIPLSSVTGVRKCWTRLLGLIPMVPNGIAVSAKEGKKYRFVTWGRQEWISTIGARQGAG